MSHDWKENLLKRLVQTPERRLSRIPQGVDAPHLNKIQAQFLKGLEKRYDQLVRDYDLKMSKEQESTPILPGFSSHKQFELYLADKLVREIDLPNLPIELSFPYGDKLICAPYDADWGHGARTVYPRMDGHAFAMGSGRTASGSGVGVGLTTEVPVLAEVTPRGRYRWSYANISPDNLFSSHTAGGLVMHAFQGDRMIAENKANLWSKYGLAKLSGESRGGDMAEARSPGFSPFGPSPLAPLRFNMYPGLQYSVWVFAWLINHNERNGNEVFSTISFEMPCMSVHLGPQPEPPR